jgi:hypothetical protein
MIRFCVILLSFLVLSICSFSQSKTIKKELEWSKNRNYKVYKQQKKVKSGEYLTFNGAHYPDESTFLPYFSELLDIRSLSNVKVTLHDLRFSPLNQSEILTSEAKDYIDEKIRIRSDVYLSDGQPKLAVKFVPVRKNASSGQYEKLEEFTLKYQLLPEKKIKAGARNEISENSVFSDGKWVKIRIKKTGLYKLTYTQLKNMGFDNLTNINIYGNSGGVLPIDNQNYEDKDPEKNAISYRLGGDNTFDKGDYILFYGESPHKWKYDEKIDFFYKHNHPYTDYNYYFITNSKGTTKSVSGKTQPSGSPEKSITTFTDFKHHEINDKNLLISGQLWVGELFDLQEEKSFSFDFPDFITGSKVKFQTDFVGRSPIESNVSVLYNNQTISNKVISPVSYNFTGDYAKKVRLSDSLVANSSPIDLTVKYNKNSASALGWLDFITVNARRNLRMDGEQLLFNIAKSQTPKIVEVNLENSENIQAIWEVTDPNNPRKISYTNVNGTISFNLTTDTIWRKFIALKEDGAYKPESMGAIDNQNLHGYSVADLLIITKERFMEQSREIARLHENYDNMKVHVVTDNEIYNEFSSGCPDPAAIRNFVRMVYERSSNQDSLEYLLLVGDGSYDNWECHSNNNLITYQSKESLNYSNSFVSDDFFGLLDPTDNSGGRLDGLVDIGVGRLPVSDLTQAQNVVEKIRYYMRSMENGFWSNRLCFVADDEDNNLHMRDADKLARFVENTYPSFAIDKIYLDNYEQQSKATGTAYPAVNEEIGETINNGVLIFNYTGHGGEKQLAHEKIITEDDIDSWVNFNRMPVFMTATCEFTRWDAVNYTSAGEKVLLNPKGGAIALFSTTRLVYASLNYELNEAFYNQVFEKKPNGKPYRLGDVVRYTKNNAGQDENKRNFSLIGDPAITLPLGEKQIVTDSIKTNNRLSDTLQALDKVSISGHVNEYSGTLDQNYSGNAFIRVKGKKQTVTTKANDGGTPFQYKDRKNILFKGTVTVKDGYFESDFVVPLDLTSEYGTGKMNYFSDNSSIAQGYDKSFIVGGTSDNVLNDEQGPDINLYMNNKDFVSGGITNENPVLIAELTDSSGINISGSGVGHNLTATLDGKASSKIVMNDYYQADENSYQKGQVEYQFSDLEKGRHTLKLEAWDVNNNASSSVIEFRVTESENFKLDHVLNYPNPFTQSTQFYFEHNRPNEQLDVMIQVFTVTGKLVKTIHRKIFASGFRVGPIPWNGKDDFGDKIGKGVYLYRLKVRSENGKTAEKIEKLVILK